jgi:hypothetical protein
MSGDIKEGIHMQKMINKGKYLIIAKIKPTQINYLKNSSPTCKMRNTDVPYLILNLLIVAPSLLLLSPFHLNFFP